MQIFKKYSRGWGILGWTAESDPKQKKSNCNTSTGNHPTEWVRIKCAAASSVGNEWNS